MLNLPDILISENDLLKTSFTGSYISSLIHLPTGLELVSHKAWPGHHPTPIWFGTGGLGSTLIYAAEKPPANATFDTITADNLIALSYRAVAENRTSDEVAFTVETPWYRVEKLWAIEGSRIRLDVTFNLLKPGWYSEPHLAFLFYGDWNSWAKQGIPYRQTTPVEDSVTELRKLAAAGISKTQGITGAVDCTTWDERNRIFCDWIELRDGTQSPTLRMTKVSGWQPQGAAMEQNLFVDEGLVEYGIHWMTWWGGNPPGPDRYRQFEPRTWTDSYTLEVTPSHTGT